jgi:[acyl-carrier-protein] S-malonyltransferase
MRAFVFPGQGSQAVGMGRDLAAASPVAKAVFQEVDDALGQNLFRLMCEGPEDQLTLTENAQAAIMANAIATLRVMEVEGGISLQEKCAFVAGHSLGEYTALCAAGAFDVATTARLLKLRGQAMQAAVPVGLGGMAALLGADIAKAEALAAAAAISETGVEVCTVANDNDPGQVVISGHIGAIERAIEMVKDLGIKRGILLPVSAPFHCPLMQPAADAMAAALAETTIAAPLVRLFANVTAAPVSEPDLIVAQLVQQVTGRVRWRESAIAMAAAGVTDFVEVGGKVLSPMIKRSAGDDVTTTSVISMDDIEALLKTL